MHNSKTVWCIQTIYTPNNCSTIRDFPFLSWTACKLRSASYGSKHASHIFSICHFVQTYSHNLKTKGRIRTFYLSNDCSTIEDTCVSIFWGRAVCEIQLVSYESKHASQPLPRWHFVHTCIYTHNSKITGCKWMFYMYISNNCSYYQRCLFSRLELDAIYN